MKIHKIIEVIPLSDFNLRIKFDNGKSKDIDIKPFINKGISKELEDTDFFNKVKAIDGYITWENGYDFCPNFLYNYSID
jgi:Protein of unknown function (DUF2442)